MVAERFGWVDFRGGVVGGPMMEGGPGIWEQLKERVWGGEGLLSKGEGRRGEEGWEWGSLTNGCGKARSSKRVIPASKMVFSRDEAGPERSWDDGPGSPIGSPGPV